MIHPDGLRSDCSIFSYHFQCGTPVVDLEGVIMAFWERGSIQSSSPSEFDITMSLVTSFDVFPECGETKTSLAFEQTIRMPEAVNQQRDNEQRGNEKRGIS